MKSLAIALALLAPAKAQACDSFAVHGFSYHSDRDLIADVTEVNPGLGCRIVQGDTFLEVGGYKNSFGDFSLYAVHTSTLEGWGYYGGLATGYDEMVGTEATGGVTGLLGLAYVGEVVTYRMTPSYDSKDGDVGLVVGVSFDLGGF